MRLYFNERREFFHVQHESQNRWHIRKLLLMRVACNDSRDDDFKINFIPIKSNGRRLSPCSIISVKH